MNKFGKLNQIDPLEILVFKLEQNVGIIEISFNVDNYQIHLHFWNLAAYYKNEFEF